MSRDDPAAVNWELTVDDEQVCAADAAREHPDKQFVWLGMRGLHTR